MRWAYSTMPEVNHIINASFRDINQDTVLKGTVSFSVRIYRSHLPLKAAEVGA